MKSILKDAAKSVTGPRMKDYGPPSVNHARTAGLWSAYLGIHVSPADVCFLNILQKASRSKHRITRDALVDIAGYAENIAMLADEA